MKKYTFPSSRALGYVSTVLVFLILMVVWMTAATVNAKEEKQSMFKDSTYEALKAYEAADRVIAVVQCKSVVVAHRGTRSERQTMETIVVGGPASLPPGSQLALSTYAQGPHLMKAGETYLVAAYVESKADPLALIEIVPIHDVSKDWKAAQDEFEARLAP